MKIKNMMGYCAGRVLWSDIMMLPEEEQDKEKLNELQVELSEYETYMVGEEYDSKR